MTIEKTTTTIAYADAEPLTESSAD